MSAKKRFFCPDFPFFTPLALLLDNPSRKISIQSRRASVRPPEIIITNGDCGPPRHCVSCSRLTVAVVRRRKILPRVVFVPFSADRDAEIDCVPHAGDRYTLPQPARLQVQSGSIRSGTAFPGEVRYYIGGIRRQREKRAERKGAGNCRIGIPDSV